MFSLRLVVVVTLAILLHPDVLFANSLMANPRNDTRAVEIGCVDGKCFYTDENVNGTSFVNALEYCQKLGLFPAVITSTAQNSIVTGGVGPHRPFWLPATDFGSEGTFRWIRNGAAFAFNDWLPGHPHVGPERGDVDNNCAYVYPESGGRSWLNLPCYTIWRPLCEFP